MGKFTPENPIFDGKNHGFPVDFPLIQSSDIHLTSFSIFCCRAPLDRGFPGYTLTAEGECEMKGEGFFVAIGVVGAVRKSGRSRGFEGDSKGFQW